MAAWTPKLESLIFKVGEYADTQIKDLIDPKAGAKASAVRIAFRYAAQGKPLMEKACKEAGFEFREDFDFVTGICTGCLYQLAGIAEQNGSHAAEKIRKVLPVAMEVMRGVTEEHGSMVGQIKNIKQKNIQY